MQIDWLATPMGQSLLAQEQELARGMLDRVFGDQALQIGLWGPHDLFLQHVRTQFSALLAAEPEHGVGALVNADRLPVLTDTVDAVLLPHTLELAAHPHAVLREVDRVLRPDGRLIILGFNPLSWWGMRHRFAPAGYPPGIRRQIGRRRLADWLRLLDMKILNVKGCYASASAGRAGRLLRRWEWFASAYVLVATKESIPVTVIRPRLGQRARLVGGLVNTSTRNVS